MRLARWKKNNPNFTFKVIAAELNVTASEHDLVIVINSSMKMPAHCSAIVEKDIIVRNYFQMENKMDYFITSLYKSLVTHILNVVYYLISEQIQSHEIHAEKIMRKSKYRTAFVQSTTKLTVSGVEMKGLREAIRRIHKIMAVMKRVDRDELFDFSFIVSELGGIKLR